MPDLEVVYGESRNRVLALQIAEELANIVADGTIYLGYPVLASADDRVYVDALLVSQEHGLVAFLIADTMPTLAADWTDCIRQQDRLYSVLESHLGRHDELRKGRQLAFPINTVTVFASSPDVSLRPPGMVRSARRRQDR